MFIVDLARLLRAAFVLAREGVATALPFPEPRPFAVAAGLVLARLIEKRRPARSGSDRLTVALTRLGPSYVKLGQFLATRPDVVGAALAADLAGLRDSLPPFGLAAARSVIAQSLGAAPESLFAAIGEPIAAASIAQVHKARVVDHETGAERWVAVKVLRPGVEKRFAADLSSFYMAARLMERLYVPIRRLRPVAVVDTLARSVALEMDFRFEAAALSEMGENVRDDPGFRVPKVDWARSARPVLTMEWVDGCKLSEVERIRAAGHDLKALAATLMQSFLRHAMRDGFFHADMHQGNLFVDRKGDIVAVDFGIMGRLGPEERRFLAEILYGFIRRDYRRVAEVHFEAGYVPADQDLAAFAQALRAVGEPIRGQKSANIAMSRLLNQLFEITGLFHMATRPELILLQKTMVVVEGVTRTLDPDFDMWTVSEPVIGEWIARNLGPRGRVEKVAVQARDVIALLPRLPKLVEDTEAMLATVREAQHREAGHSGRLAWILPLWLAALALVVLALGW